MNEFTDVIEITEEIAARVREITDYDITDPLTETRAVRMSALKDMELTEATHAILLQFLIQGAYFGFEFFEIPSASEEDFGSELYLYDDCLNMLLSLIETENYLYRRGSVN